MKPHLFCLIFSCCCLNIVAQDSHYWTSAYSTSGFLTPGAVISYNGDSGVVFFNPALLASVTKNAATISGNVYQLESIRIKDGVGLGKNLSSQSPSIIPQMASGTIHIAGKKTFTIGYVLLHDPQLNYHVNQQKDGQYNVLQDYYSPGKEIFLGQYTAENKVNNTSGILSGGFKITPHLSLGFAAEANLHNQSYKSDYSVRAIINSPTPLSFPAFTNVQEYYAASYTNLGVRFKTGLAYDNGKHHLGLLISSPLLHLYGKGSFLSDFIVSNLKLDSTVPDLNLLANARQVGLKAKWKTPVSIALGYTYDYKRGQLYASLEYFSQISEYNNITPNNSYFVKGDSTSFAYGASFLKLHDVRKSIVNAGFGISYLLRPDLLGYFSVRTDFSYAKPSLFKDDVGYTDYTTDWNLVHFQVGINVKKRKFNLRPGLLLTYGHTVSHTQPLNFDSANENNVLGGEPVKTGATNFSVGLLMAYVHNF